METIKKKLTEGQMNGLVKMAETAGSDYYDLCRVGCYSATCKALVSRGLATVESNGSWKTWRVTDKGSQAISDGFYFV